MSDRDYYPAGAYNDANAPYNQRDDEPIEVICDTVVSLRKTITVDTTNYHTEYDDETGACGIEIDDGYADITDRITDQHHSITDLLGELAKYINRELQGDITHERRWELRRMLEDCEGWEDEDVDVENYETK